MKNPKLKELLNKLYTPKILYLLLIFYMFENKRLLLFYIISGPIVITLIWIFNWQNYAYIRTIFEEMVLSHNDKITKIHLICFWSYGFIKELLIWPLVLFRTTIYLLLS